jgi:hypothetical protein
MARKKFVYKRPTQETVKKQAEQKSGAYDSIYKDGINVFKVREGDFRIRVLPPTWEESEHFGYEIWWHRNIGADNQTYLCTEKMKGEACPICEERARAEREGEAEYASSLKPVKRIMMAFIDRDNEDDGPIYWAAPWQVNRDINKISMDRRSKEIFCIDDPVEGYDIDFTVEGKMRNTKYIGFVVARKSTTLGDSEEIEDEWIEFMEDNPLPEVLEFHGYNYIAAIFAGGNKEEEEENERPVRTRTRSREPEPEEEPEEKPRRSRRREVKPEEESEEKPRRTRRRESEPEITDPDESLDGPGNEPEEKPAPRRRSREPEPKEEPEEKPKSGRERLRARVREGREKTERGNKD